MAGQALCAFLLEECYLLLNSLRDNNNSEDGVDSSSNN